MTAYFTPPRRTSIPHHSTGRTFHLDGEVPDLRALRLQAGLTVPEVAGSVNVAVPTYYAWEQGRWTRLPGPQSLEGLASALGEPVEAVVAAFREAQRQRRRSETASV